MLKKLLPVMLSVVAFLGGAAGGEMLKRGAEAEAPADAAAAGHKDASASAGTGQAAAEAQAPPPASAVPAAPQEGREPSAQSTSPAEAAGSGGHGGAADSTGTAWFKFPQQFFVPVLYDGRLDSTMIMTLSVEMPSAARETVYGHEIKLRDALLRQLLIHANTGGFDGNFTSEAQLRKLRDSLTATAQAVVPAIAGILIGDIARQER